MASPRLQAGSAEVEITGRPPYMLASELAPRRAERVQAPLMAKALVLADGVETLALVTLDLFGLDAATVEAVQRAVQARCGLEPRQLMIVCAHARGAPCTVPVVGAGEVEQGYLDGLAGRVGELVAAALGAQQPAALGLGQARLPHLVYNHRLMTRNRKAITAWLDLPPDEVLAPEGEVDATFDVFVVRDAKGFPICLVWSFAADNRFAADDAVSPGLPGAVQEQVDARLGRHVPCLYLPGCGGNTSFVHDLPRTADLAASGVMAVQLETSGDPAIRLGAALRRMVLPIRDYRQYWSRADVALKAPQAIDLFGREVELLQAEGAHAVPAVVQVFRLGRMAVAGLSGMPFVELGLAVKARSPFWGTVVAANANAYLGTVATRAAFDHGGYETWPARSQPVGPGGGEFMAEEAAALLAELWKQRTR
jgi:hypothetical protein